MATGICYTQSGNVKKYESDTGIDNSIYVRRLLKNTYINNSISVSPEDSKNVTGLILTSFLIKDSTYISDPGGIILCTPPYSSYISHYLAGPPTVDNYKVYYLRGQNEDKSESSYYTWEKINESQISNLSYAVIIASYYPKLGLNPSYYKYTQIGSVKKYTAFLWIGDVKTNGGSGLENFSEWCYFDFCDKLGGPLVDNIGFNYTTLTVNGDNKPTINIKFYCLPESSGHQSYTGSFKFYFGLIPYGSKPQDYSLPTWFSNNFRNLISSGIGLRPGDAHYLGKYQNIISNTSSDSLVYGLASKIYENSYVSFWVDNNTNNFSYFHVDFTSNNSNNPLPIGWSQLGSIELNDSNASNRFGSIDGLEKFNVRIKVFFEH